MFCSDRSIDRSISADDVDVCVESEAKQAATGLSQMLEREPAGNDALV
jgi:hypothetical protein